MNITTFLNLSDPVVKVADVIGSVHNVQTGEDDHDKGGDDGDDADDDIDDGHQPGPGRLVPSGQACDPLHQVEGPDPVSLSKWDLIPGQITASSLI